MFSFLDVEREVAGMLDDVASMLEETAEVTAGECCMISTCSVSFNSETYYILFPICGACF